jgi:hypothetical protein
MGSEVAFNAAKGAYRMYGALLKDIAQDLGMEEAFDLHARRGESFGAMIAEMIEYKLGGEEFNMQAVAPVLAGVAKEGGLFAEVEATPTSAKMETFKCPIYEGFRLAGWRHEEIGAMCSRHAAAEAAEIRKTYPQHSARIKFRLAPAKSCVEEFLWEH